MPPVCCVQKRGKVKTLKKSAYVIGKCSKYCVTSSTGIHNYCHVTNTSKLKLYVVSAILHFALYVRL